MEDFKMSLPNLPFYKQSPPLGVMTIETERSIDVGKGYFRVKFVDMRLARDLVGSSLLVPSLHVVASKRQRTDWTNESIVGPAQSYSSRQGDLRRTFIAPTVVTPILPFDGNALQLQLGLFSIPFKDLAKEMLDLLVVLASPIPNPEVKLATGIAVALRQAIDSLFGLDETKLLLRWKGELGELEKLQQKYVVVTPKATTFEKGETSIVNGKLLVGGATVDRTNYMVFSVQVSHMRPDWRALPEIEPYFQAWNHARSTYTISEEEYNVHVGNLLKALRSSPNLVPVDAERIAKEEIIPLVEIGESVQESLFREAGFDNEPWSNLEYDAGLINGFEDTDVVRS